MKRRFGFFLCLIMIAAGLLLFSSAALAVPAAPGTHPEGGACKSHTGSLTVLSDIAENAALRGGPARAPGRTSAPVDIPLAVIVIGFGNQAYRADFDWAHEIFLADMSLAEYYTDMSFGKFTFTPVRETSAYGSGGNTNRFDAANDGVIHVTLSSRHEDWRLEYAMLSLMDIAVNRSLQEALLAALAQADAYIDFSAYDVNGDGVVATDELALAFVAAGYEASSSIRYEHGKNLYLWSHAYSFSDANETYGFTYALPSPDGVTLDSYIAISEQEDDGSQEPIGTLAHELGHYLGLPDLYDTDYSTRQEWSGYDVSYLSLMCAGLYGTDPDTGAAVPYSLDAWSRVLMGWAEPENAVLSGDYTLTAQNYADDAGYGLVRIPTQNPGEYYLLENRSFTKWDRGLAAAYERDSGGVILWHIDDAVWEACSFDNTVNNANHRPAVMPLYAETDNGADAFIGRNAGVDLLSAFYDRSVWSNRFASFGPALELPIYGTGGSADLRSGRTLSGIRVEFLSDPAEVMQVRVNTENHIHNAVFTYVEPPTCTEPGTACYMCSQCGMRFADPEGAQTLNEPIIVAALGHTQPNAEGLCARCGVRLVAEDALCPYCHTLHSGFPGRVTAFFHKILYYLMRLFGRA